MPALQVLFLAHSYPRRAGDAAGSFLHHLAHALAAHEVAVHVVAPSAPGYPAEDRIDGIPIHRFRYAPARWETLAYTGTMAAEVRGSARGKAAMLGLLLAGARAADHAARTLRPDVIHAHWWFPGGIAGAFAAWRTRTPLLTTMHGSDLRLVRQVPAAHVMLRHVVASSAATTTVSTWLADALRAMAPAATPLVEPMPVASSLFVPPTSSAREPRVLFVGRLNPQKGIGPLLEAFARLSGNAHLDIVGDGPDRPALLARAVALGIAERLTWHGALPQPALAPLYQRATTVVMPSVDEGLGLVAVEAQLCETPVVAYASGGTTDVVRHEETGLLVAPGDVEALAVALDRLLGDPTLARRLGQTGRMQALERFAPERVAARYAALYRALARRTEGVPPG